MDIGLYTQASTYSIPAGTDRVRTTGFSVSGTGGADYIYDASLASTAVPTSFTSANGRRFRLDAEQTLTIEMFGGMADLQLPNGLYGANASGSDNLSAFNAYWQYVQYSVAENPAYVIVQPLHFRASGYYFTGPLEPRAMVHLIGANGSGDRIGTIFRFPANACGLIVNSQHTQSSGTGYSQAELHTAEGSTVENINFVGGGGSDRAKHGSWLRAPANLVYCGFSNFAGCGTAIIANATATDMSAGNVSSARIEHCYYENNGGVSAFLADGSDANANKIDQIRVFGSYGSAIIDRSEFGNVYTAPEIDNWGSGGRGRVYNSGENYLLVRSNDYGVTPGTNSRVWLPVGSASNASARYPQWTTGNTYEANLPILVEGGVNSTTVFGGYAEGSTFGSDNLGNSAESGAVIIGGTWWWAPRSNHMFTGDEESQHCLFGQNGVGGFQDWNNSQFQAGLGNQSWAAVGWKVGDTYAHFAHYDGREGSMWVLQPDGGGNLHYNFRGLNTGGPRIYALTLTNTQVTFGRATPVPAVFAPYTIALGNNTGDLNSYRVVAMASAVPTSGSHAKGELVFNNGNDPSHDGVDYWRCTASGTPGTWVARP